MQGVTRWLWSRLQHLVLRWQSNTWWYEHPPWGGNRADFQQGYASAQLSAWLPDHPVDHQAGWVADVAGGDPQPEAGRASDAKYGSLEEALEQADVDDINILPTSSSYQQQSQLARQVCQQEVGQSEPSNLGGGASSPTTWTTWGCPCGRCHSGAGHGHVAGTVDHN